MDVDEERRIENDPTNNPVRGWIGCAVVCLVLGLAAFLWVHAQPAMPATAPGRTSQAVTTPTSATGK